MNNNHNNYNLNLISFSMLFELNNVYFFDYHFIYDCLFYVNDFFYINGLN